MQRPCISPTLRPGQVKVSPAQVRGLCHACCIALPQPSPFTSPSATQSMAPTKPWAPPSPTDTTMAYSPEHDVPQLSAQRDEGVDMMWLWRIAVGVPLCVHSSFMSPNYGAKRQGCVGWRPYDLAECHGNARSRTLCRAAYRNYKSGMFRLSVCFPCNLMPAKCKCLCPWCPQLKAWNPMLCTRLREKNHYAGGLIAVCGRGVPWS